MAWETPFECIKKVMLLSAASAKPPSPSSFQILPMRTNENLHELQQILFQVIVDINVWCTYLVIISVMAL